MVTMLDLHRLRILRELKYRGTLAAVAQALSYSPSAVSQHLAQLQVEAGVTLIEPVGRRVRLTPQAEILVAHTEVLLQTLERAEAELAASLDDISGTLRVGTFQSVTLTGLPSVLTVLQRAHPRLRVELAQSRPETYVSGLMARDFDLVLTEEYPGQPGERPDGIEQRPVGGDALVVIQQSGQAPITRLEELADRAWVMDEGGGVPRAWMTAVCRQAGFEPDVRFESSDLATQIRLVETGHAVAIVPELALRGLRADVEHQPVPGAGHRRRLLTAVRSGAATHPTIVAFRDALAEALTPGPGEAPSVLKY